MSPAPPAASATRGGADRIRYFYTAAAALLLLLVFVGFQDFYLHGQAYPGRPLTPPIRTVLVVHGIAMTAWVLLLFTQTLLIAKRKHAWHMALGRAGAVLAAVIVVSGLTVAIRAAKVNPPEMKLWSLGPRQFLAVPFVTMLIFAAYVAIAVWKRRRPAVHRPLMLLATLGAVSAATDRIASLGDLYRHTVLGTVFGPFFIPLAIAGLLLVVKGALTRSLDRWFAVGYLVLVLADAGTMRVATTHAWDSFAGLLLG